MIKSVLTNEILRQITSIEENRFKVSNVKLPSLVMDKLRKNSKKKSSYASNKIEGNPLTEKQVEDAIDSDSHKHFLKPEQEVRNYFAALSFLEKKKREKAKVNVKLIMDVQAIVEKGASKEKIGLRSAMPPGVLFAVYDAQTGHPDYIPPENTDIPELLDELEKYIHTTDDHPLIIAAIVHYQLVTIHPFEDGNGRTARLISGYILDYYGYGFQGIGSLEEYFAYDSDEYFNSLQMGLPALYYSGRDNPPHPEIWIVYFLRMMELYSSKACEISKETKSDNIQASLSFLNAKEKELLLYLINNKVMEFTPIEIIMPDGEDVSAVRFDALIYGMELAFLAGKGYGRHKSDLFKKVEGIASVANIPEIQIQSELINKILHTDYVDNAKIDEFEHIRLSLRNLMKYVPKVIIKYDTDFTDEILSTEWNDSELENDELKNYKVKAEFYVRQNQDNIAITKLKTNRPLTDVDIKTLEQILWKEVGSKEDYEKECGYKPLGEFVREIVGLDMNAAKEAFSEFLNDTNLDSRQIYFINQIVEYIVHNGMMKDLSVLQESPFTDKGSVVEIFTDLTVWMEIRKAIDQINANAVA